VASDQQRHVRRSPLLFTTPLVLLAVLALVLLWEITRGNVTGELSRQWPWRLQLMDTDALGSLLAVALAAVLGRAQYARTVRPALGWRSSWVPGVFVPDEPAWEVGVLNGGPQHAVVERVEYQLVPHDGVPGAWTDHAGLLRDLAAMGLVQASTTGRYTSARVFPCRAPPGTRPRPTARTPSGSSTRSTSCGSGCG